MALTKSLHTVTSATKVAEYIVKREAFHGNSAAALANEALAVLGHTLDGSDTSQRIVANCKAILTKAGVL